MKPRIYSILSNFLHTSEKIKTYPQITVAPYFFSATEMDFYFRKVLKYNNIKYSYDRNKKRLIINDKDSPLRLYMEFDEFGVTIRPIPWTEFSYFFQSSYPSELLRKMLEKGIINSHTFKKIIVPIHIESLSNSFASIT